MSPGEEIRPIATDELREGLLRFLEGVRSSDPRELARGVLDGDGDLPAVLLEALPRLTQTLFEAAKVILERMESMPPEETAEILAHSLPGADGSAAGELINSLSRLLIRLHEQKPSVMVEERLDFFSQAIKTVDFGKLRKALNFQAVDRLEAVRREIELLGDSPVALVNLFSVVAPAVNQALEVLKSLFKVLELPAEAMTYALLNIIEDIHWKDAAQVVNGVATLVVNLHRGSYILGESSLYTSTTFSHVASDFTQGIDAPLLAEALAALGEEGEALVSALAEQALQNEELLTSFLEATASLANAIIRSLSSFLEATASLPEDRIAGLKKALSESLEPQEIANLMRALLLLSRQTALLGERPTPLRQELLGVLRDELYSRFTPQDQAQGLNRVLQALNRRMAMAPSGEEAGLDAFLSGVNRVELERFFKTSALRLGRILASQPDLAKVFARGVFTVFQQAIKGYLTGWRGRRKAGRR